MNTSVIGRVLGRVEGEDKVTGNSTYSADILRADTLWAGFLRSPYPDARILSIDASRAQKLHGVKEAPITAEKIFHAWQQRGVAQGSNLASRGNTNSESEA